MSDSLSSPPPIPPEEEIVNLDQCSSTNALVAGAAVAFVLSFVPILNSLCCIHLAIAGAVAVFVFTKKHNIRIETWQGIKLAALAVFYGSVLAVIVLDLGILLSGGADAESLKETLIAEVEKSGKGNADEAIDFIESVIPDQLTAIHLAGIFIFQIVMVGIASFIGGAIGGSIGAAMFKKGPLAK